ncbi:MAG: tyrosine-type recombinase/integrase [Candidatus Thorarchaeota archaeon]|nr:tyrosine-type recombinase/integrase [Candidatus Thorarchaeota archaeon]
MWKRRIGGRYIYYVDFYYQGKRVRKSTKTSDRKLAELFLKDIEVRIAKEEFGFEAPSSNRIKLGEFFEKYLEFSEATKAANTVLLDGHAQKVFLNFTGNTYLNRITSQRVEEFKLYRLKSVKPVSFNLEFRHLKAMFEKAVKWGHIPSNPFMDVKQVKVKSNNLPKYLTKEEVRKLLDAIPEGRFKSLIIFYLHTGCRRGEALSLTWEDVDLDERKVTIRESKSGESRIIPMNGRLFEILSGLERNGSVVFEFSPYFVTHKFKECLKSADIKGWKTLSLHSLRHTFASHLVMAGRDLYTVGKLLGHSSVAVTQMYAHLAPDFLKVAVESLQY